VISCKFHSGPRCDRRATSTIPIVLRGRNDPPVGIHFKPSPTLVNITGVSFLDLKCRQMVNSAPRGAPYLSSGLALMSTRILHPTTIDIFGY